MDPERIHVVGNPQPDQPRPLESAAPEPSVLFLGRLVTNKGCDVLLRAVSQIPAFAKVRIAGDGPERENLESLAKELGLESRVDFLGWASPDRVRELLNRSCVLAVPSLWPEPFGLVALEAYAAARPVVASSVGGLADLVVDGVTGRSVPPDDPTELAKALTNYLTDLPAALRAGIAGREFSNRNFSMETHLDRVDSVYSQAVESAS
jgi:glycosyltransferase involved in cell wall biosynthesis